MTRCVVLGRDLDVWCGHPTLTNLRRARVVLPLFARTGAALVTPELAVFLVVVRVVMEGPD